MAFILGRKNAYLDGTICAFNYDETELSKILVRQISNVCLRLTSLNQTCAGISCRRPAEHLLCGLFINHHNYMEYFRAVGRN